MGKPYTITFYSLNNRIGRTQALIEVGKALAYRGKKVLLVDLDLKSPGLHTYSPSLFAGTNAPYPGVVEYITDYLDKKRSPVVTGYLYKCLPEDGVVEVSLWVETEDARSVHYESIECGELWVMPAGRRDAAYWKALAHLDWMSLYEQHDGFLFLEDTWLQWTAAEYPQKAIRPDYVLIDAPYDPLSAGDIITRQFADAVALFVYPDEQTLAGLKGTCQTIRSEVEGSRGSRIALYVVLDTVPPNAVPDEAWFKQAGIELVSQPAYLPRLTDKLISQHRDEVLRQLQNMNPRELIKDGKDPLEYVPQLEKWASHFSDDEQVVTEVVRHFSSKELGLYERALYYLDLTIERTSTRALRKLRAEIMEEKLGDSKGRREYDEWKIQRRQAILDLLQKWEEDQQTSNLIKECVRHLNPEVPEVKDERWFNPDWNPPSPPPDASRSYQMISGGAVLQVIPYLESNFPDPTALPAGSLFDLAVAYWVARDDRRPDLLKLVVEQLLVRQSEKQSQGGDLTASEYQMLSLAYHGLGKADKARDCVEKAQGAIGSGDKKVRSYWRYGPDLDADLFEHDCLLQRRFIKGKGRRPHFFDLG